MRMSTESNRGVLVIGATGFIGSKLTKRLWEGGYLPTALVRRGEKPGSAAVGCIEGDPVRPGPWQSEVKRYDAVINLAGSSIFRRWTAQAKERSLKVVCLQHAMWLTRFWHRAGVSTSSTHRVSATTAFTMMMSLTKAMAPDETSSPISLDSGKMRPSEHRLAVHGSFSAALGSYWGEAGAPWRR